MKTILQNSSSQIRFFIFQFHLILLVWGYTKIRSPRVFKRVDIFPDILESLPTLLHTQSCRLIFSLTVYLKDTEFKSTQDQCKSFDVLKISVKLLHTRSFRFDQASCHTDLWGEPPILLDCLKEINLVPQQPAISKPIPWLNSKKKIAFTFVKGTVKIHIMT